jgi:hypothetical protein
MSLSWLRSRGRRCAFPTTTVDAGPRTDRGLLALAAASLVATAVVLVPALAALGGVGSVAVATAIAAIRSVPSRATAPPDESTPARRSGSTHPAD